MTNTLRFGSHRVGKRGRIGVASLAFLSLGALPASLVVAGLPASKQRNNPVDALHSVENSGSSGSSGSNHSRLATGWKSLVKIWFSKINLSA